MDSGERGMNHVAMTIIKSSERMLAKLGIKSAPQILYKMKKFYDYVQYFHLFHHNVLKTETSFKVIWPFPKQALIFTCLQYKSFENTVGKGEIARNEQFLLFPLCFLPIWIIFYCFHKT